LESKNILDHFSCGICLFPERGLGRGAPKPTIPAFCDPLPSLRA
jgi:hypothetical protein